MLYSSVTNSITVSTYIINRLKEAGVDTIFGVPGDFNMPFLDFIENDKQVIWGNNTNELNAAYAADGYARIKGVGVLVTTFGVGELSAINGVTGSYSENIPVIHIVGYPKSQAQKDRKILHHSTGDGRYHIFSNMYKYVTAASTHIESIENALSEIDRVIQTAIIEKRPGHIALPLDLMTAYVKVPEIIPHLQITPPKNLAYDQEIVLERILDAIASAENPAIYVDGHVLRYGIEKEANKFSEKSGFATFCTPMGVGAINTNSANYRGVYAGILSIEKVTEEIKKSDLLIELGSFKSDQNTGEFTLNLDHIKTITLEVSGTTVFGFHYPNVNFVELLPLLTARLPKQKQRVFSLRAIPAPIHNDDSTVITHNYLWNKIQKYIDPDSIIVAETGTASHGAIFDMTSLINPKYVIQFHYNSIGYTVPAALGAAMASRSKRVYLFVGDGSYQITFQEVSSFIRQGITPVIFLINNSGYTIEKVIHGPHKSYNDIQMWKYHKSLDYFSNQSSNNEKTDKKQSVIGVEAKINTREEFERTVEKVSSEPNKIHFVELVMPQFDAPRSLCRMVEVINNTMQ